MTQTTPCLSASIGCSASCSERRCLGHRRRAQARPPHLCRARGDRRCRCHVAARPRLAQLRLAQLPLLPTAEKLHPDAAGVQAMIRTQAPQIAPLRPQAPPFSLSAALQTGFRTGNGYENYI